MPDGDQSESRLRNRPPEEGRKETRQDTKKGLSALQPERKELWKHPVTAILLSGLVGGGLAFGWDALKNNIASRIARRDSNERAMLSFSTALYGRIARAKFLDSALDLSEQQLSRSELIDLWNDYRESVFSWNASLFSNMMLLRDASRANQFSELERIIQGTVKDTWAGIEKCLRSDVREGRRGIQRNDECCAAQRIGELTGCSYALVERAYLLARGDDAVLTKEDRSGDASLNRCNLDTKCMKRNPAPAKPTPAK